jgi:CDGSH-type Zn-finger protein
MAEDASAVPPIVDSRIGSIFGAAAYFNQGTAMKIVVSEDGPYVVTGSVPLTVQIITPNEEQESWEWTDGRSFPAAEAYKLCRCGKSKSKPFCDGTHVKIHFNGKETANSHSDRPPVRDFRRADADVE